MVLCLYLKGRFQIPAQCDLAQDLIPEWRQTQTGSLIIKGSSRSLSSPGHQYDPPSSLRLAGLARGDGSLNFGPTSYVSMSMQCPVRGVRGMRLGQARPQGEISNVTSVLGQLEMAAAEQEGKEGCGD